MKLSKTDLKGLGSLVGNDDNGFSGSSQKKKMIDQLYSALENVAKRAGATIETLPAHSLRQTLDAIYWRYKVDWPGSESEYGKLFATTFAGPLARLGKDRNNSILPGVDSQVKKQRKPRVKKQPTPEQVSATQKVQDIYDQIEKMGAKMVVKKLAYVKNGTLKMMAVENPRCKITDDNFFKIFTETAPGTLIPVVEVDLKTDPILEIASYPGIDYAINTATNRVIIVNFEDDGRHTEMIDSHVSSEMPEDIDEVVAGPNITMLPDDIEEVL